MSVVGPVWSDFVSKNITKDVKCLHFIEEGEDMFYVATYNKYGLEMHGYRQKSLMFWRCLLNVTDRSRRAQTLPLVFVPKVYSTSQSDTVDLFIKDRECEVFIGKIPSVNSPKTFKLAFYGPDWWSMMDELAIRPDYNLERMGCISKGFVDMHKLRGYASAVVSHMDKKFEFKLCKKSKSVEMFSTTTLRDMVRSGFWRDQWVWFYLSKDTSLEDGVVIGSACSLIHATDWIQAWGKPVWTGVDDVFLLAPMLKHVVPSLLAQLVVLLSFNSVSGQHVRCFHASAWIQDSGATWYEWNLLWYRLYLLTE
ncbi:hypothetical protein Tco_0607737 [Tanacetum coccineum]